MAKRFQFRLETIRRLREQAELLQRRAVAAAARLAATDEHLLAELKDRILETSANARSLQQTQAVLDVRSLRDEQVHWGWLRREAADASTRLAERQIQLHQERLRLLDAARRRQVLDKLRDRRWRQHRAVAQREEQIQTDEAAIQAYNRNSGRGGIEGPERS